MCPPFYHGAVPGAVKSAKQNVKEVNPIFIPYRAKRRAPKNDKDLVSGKSLV